MKFSVSPKGSIPQDREEILALAESEGRAIYELVRRLLDDIEAAAPWDVLYYPPDEVDKFLAIEWALIRLIEELPERVQQLTQAIAFDNAGDAGIVDDARFFFGAIHDMVVPDLRKLEGRLEAHAGAQRLGSEDRAQTCEISADLKGKSTSSLMGATATLIAGERWNGVEIEPILFPEKAEEFERNRHLAKTLAEITNSIRDLAREVPLTDLIERWQTRQRVDQYALTPFYSFLGNLGELMKVTSRRALYSGDYHQIQKRERMLSARVNELSMLHSQTWDPSFPEDNEAHFQLMVQKATELAAILNIDMLKVLVGGKIVKDIQALVEIAGEKEKLRAQGHDVPSAAPRRWLELPDQYRSLVPLLHEEDLKTFLDLLLGAVQKRASLVFEREREVAESSAVEAAADIAAEQESVAGAVVEPAPTVEPMDVEPIDLDAIEVESVESLLAEVNPPKKSPEPTESWQIEPVEALPAGRLIEPSFAEPLAAGGLARDSTGEPEPVIFDEADRDLLQPLPELNLLDDAHVSRVGFEAPRQERGSLLPELDFLDASSFLDPIADGDPGAGYDHLDAAIDSSERLAALRALETSLNHSLATANAKRKPFDFLRRLLRQKKLIPPTMIRSMDPFLDELKSGVMPQLRNVISLGEMPMVYGDDLEKYCQALGDRGLSPDDMKEEVPRNLERVQRLLEGLKAKTSDLIERLATQETPTPSHRFQW